MVNLLLKYCLSAAIIAAASEVAKRNTLLGGILTSLPLISVLSMIWLYQDTKNVQSISQFAYAIFWMVIPSLLLFISLPEFLKRSVPFYVALTFSCLLTIAAYWGMNLLLSKWGIKL